MRINSPKQAALYSALIIAIVSGTLTGAFSSSHELWPLYGGIGFVVAFIVSYFLVFYMIERFLYGKIKLIYKNILNLKTQKDQDIKINMSTDVLGTVSSEVESWADVKTREIKQLKDQEAFRREFIGNLSHELKTPIFSIQGYILTLLEGGLDDPTVNKEFLMRAAKGVDRMTHIIEDLDMINKFESGNIPLEIQKENIVDLAKEILDSVEYKAREKNVELKLKGNEDRPIYVMMDRQRIGQVVTNLVNNAINYSKEEGGSIEVRFYKMDNALLVEVADNGIGMSEEHLPRLFERFYRVDRSRSRNAGGTGLGLAIVKHIVEAHGQTINARSTKDIGSTFSFTLELA